MVRIQCKHLHFDDHIANNIDSVPVSMDADTVLLDDRNDELRHCVTNDDLTLSTHPSRLHHTLARACRRFYFGSVLQCLVMTLNLRIILDDTDPETGTWYLLYGAMVGTCWMHLLLLWLLQRLYTGPLGGCSHWAWVPIVLKYSIQYHMSMRSGQEWSSVVILGSMMVASNTLTLGGSVLSFQVRHDPSLTSDDERVIEFDAVWRRYTEFQTQSIACIQALLVHICLDDTWSDGGTRMGSILISFAFQLLSQLISYGILTHHMRTRIEIALSRSNCIPPPPSPPPSSISSAIPTPIPLGIITPPTSATPQIAQECRRRLVERSCRNDHDPDLFAHYIRPHQLDASTIDIPCDPDAAIRILTDRLTMRRIWRAHAVWFLILGVVIWSVFATLTPSDVILDRWVVPIPECRLQE